MKKKAIIVRSHVKAGMAVESGRERCENKCISERDVRSWDCFWAGWPQNDPNHYYCHGTHNEEELNRCLKTCGN